MNDNTIYNNSKALIRYEWIDVLKFIGIFSIYLGHCGQGAGKLYPFVFIYHVPLFFFISGFFANKGKDKSIKEYILAKAKQLLVPYVFFSIVSNISYALLGNYNGIDVKNMFIKSFWGIRNTLTAGSLWFVPCMFVVSILYFILNRTFTKKWIVLISTVLLFISTQTILVNNPMIVPSWFMNIDSAMYYIIYYALGDILFDKIRNFKFTMLSIFNKVLVVIISLGMLIITTYLYFNGPESGFNLINDYFAFVSYIPLIKSIYNVLIAFIIIYICILVAYLLKDVKLFANLGKNTLKLCCMENITKIYLDSVLSMIGLGFNISNPLNCIFYTFSCLIVAQGISIKVIKKYFPFI